MSGAPTDAAHAAERADAPRGEAMAAAANPHAVEAALDMLRAGGGAVDAAIAAELVLGLVEPQSSGIGGGGFMLFYDAESEAITGYDGREWAPAGATPGMFLDARGRPLPFVDAQASGLSTGTPLLVAMLKLAHEEHGEMAFSGTYREITPPTRLVYTEIFEPGAQPADDEGATVTVTFEDRAGQTRLVSHSHFPSKEVLDMVLATGMEDGMRETMNQLDELAASLA